MTQDVISQLLFREYLLNERQALLMRVDYIERLLGFSPRTAELRKEAKDRQYQHHGAENMVESLGKERP